MEADCNELDDDFLHKIQDNADEDRDDDFVCRFLPVPSICVAVYMVVLHGW